MEKATGVDETWPVTPGKGGGQSVLWRESTVLLTNFVSFLSLQSLSGHTTAIEAVRFSPTEELVCAGSCAGAVKVWDLEAARMVRTLTGHRAGIKAVDFHPYGDFLATGSTDTNIKV